jgi:predicted MPP superfamily phosphohydrolase
LVLLLWCTGSSVNQSFARGKQGFKLRLFYIFRWGDAHFGRKAEHPLVKQHIQRGQEEYFKWLATDLKKRKIKTVLFTGDIFDTRNTINVEALIKTVRLFSIEFNEFNCIIDLGNHDMYYENSYDICSTKLSLISQTINSYLSLATNIENLNLQKKIYENLSSVYELAQDLQACVEREYDKYLDHEDVQKLPVEENRFITIGSLGMLPQNSSDQLAVYIGAPFPGFAQQGDSTVSLSPTSVMMAVDLTRCYPQPSVSRSNGLIVEINS